MAIEDITEVDDLSCILSNLNTVLKFYKYIDFQSSRKKVSKKYKKLIKLRQEVLQRIEELNDDGNS